MWYGCGNTSLPNPSTIRIGLKPRRPHRAAPGCRRYRPGLEHRHHADLRRRARRAARPPRSRLRRHRPDARLRQDLRLAPDLRHRQGGRAGGTRAARVDPAPRQCRARRAPPLRAGAHRRRATASTAAASTLAEPAARCATATCCRGEETFDPPTTPLDANGQGNPYAVYGFGAHMAEVEVDIELGTVKVLKITAAHDVGRAINPTLVEGQIEGGVAQGLGMALMEEFFPGRGENLHDYLIPTDRRHAAGRIDPDRGCLARRPVRRQGHRRAGADPDRAGDPQRHPRCDRRAHPPRAGDARPRPRRDPRGGRR